MSAEDGVKFNYFVVCLIDFLTMETVCRGAGVVALVVHVVKCGRYRLQDGIGVQNAFNVSGGGAVCGNGRDGGVSPNAAAAAAVAAVAHGLRRQMCNMVAAAQRPPDHPHTHLSLPAAAAAAAAAGLQLPLSQSPRSTSGSVSSPLHSTTPPNPVLEMPKQQDPFRPFVSPRPDSRYTDQTLRDQLIDTHDMGPPRAPMPKNDKEQMMISNSTAGPSSGIPTPVKLESPSSENRGESI
ncbi:hypothetical protein EVAR_56064_1 [Eumeta japonica]|uniref:Uncharacterized protein n=1 Tax=Eumeta variegata TaxID=151549 RepID=A0A4C1YRD7_EUMVA|nr:hypothetical protein EVAR_56064_1 [Eumeta japonica]